MKGCSNKAISSALAFFILQFVITLFNYQLLWSQEEHKNNIRHLDRQQKRIEQKVRKTELLLEHTKKTQKRSYNELNLLKQQIELRENLVHGLGKQISEIEQEIERIDQVILSMQADISRFQQSFAKAIKTSYKTQGNLSILIWVFSAKSFYQSYNRLIYFKEFARYRKNQILLIKRTRSYLAKKKAQKEIMKNHVNVLFGKRLAEKQKLDQARELKGKLLSELKSSEQEYQKRIEEYKNELVNIKAQIRQLIIESRREVSIERKEEIDKLSRNFANNKGKLPWPMPANKGVIVGQFGKTVTPTGHAVINDGIFIATPQNQPVRAIFHGIVTLISKVPGYGKVVIIQHGNYRTVYANLEDVSVQKGDKVEVLQEIGVVKTNEHTGETQLYFQIYKGFNPVNPTAWIANN